jgi:hypothetical protein
VKRDAFLAVASFCAVLGVARYLEYRALKNEIRRVIAHANLITKEAASA